MSENDLFEKTEFLPIAVQQILNDFSMEESTYENCNKLKQNLEKVGYSCDYCLDAQPFNLHKI